jgi:hypothetical protein
MDFEKLKNTIENCDTSSNASSSSENVFIRKLINPTLVEEEDFDTHFEKGKKPKKYSENGWSNCREFQNYNGVSVNDYSESTKKEVLKLYKVKFNVSPNYKKGACLFKIKKSGGVVEATPSNSDKFHYTFFKEDTFSVSDKIDVLEIIDLTKECT